MIAGKLMLHSIGEVCHRTGAAASSGRLFIVIVANMMQVGLQFHARSVSPSISPRSIPIRGFSKMFSTARAACNCSMNLIKVVLVGWSPSPPSRPARSRSSPSSSSHSCRSSASARDIRFHIGIRVGVLLLVLAIIDYVYQRYRIEQSLKMTKQEVKDEMRRMEGDPVIKHRRRQIAMQRAHADS